LSANDTSERLRLVLITGLSGSGRSTVAKALEDVGYFCVDNLPLPLLRTFLADPRAQVGELRRVAVVSDVRAPGFAEHLPKLLADLRRERSYDLLVLFLEASEEALVRRYSETRRSHPLGRGERPLVEDIRHERQLLAELRGHADLVLDTTDWSVHEVRREIYRELADGDGDGPAMLVSLVSFGFKHGIPHGSDLVFDVRFLPNPYFLPGLRDKSGHEPEVLDFLDRQPEFRQLLDRLESLLLFLLPRYRRENRSYLTVAIGCTGGRHRSVAAAEILAQRLADHGWPARLHHRDLERP